MRRFTVVLSWLLFVSALGSAVIPSYATNPTADSLLQNKLALAGSLFDSVTGSNAILPPSCSPIYQQVVLPNGVTSTAWYYNSSYSANCGFLTIPSAYLQSSYSQCIWVQPQSIGWDGSWPFGGITSLGWLTVANGVTLMQNGQIVGNHAKALPLLDMWTHYCMTFNSGTNLMSLYSNGQPVTSWTVTNPVWASSSHTPIIIGQSLSGFVYMARIYTTAIAASDVMAAFLFDAAGPSTSLPPTSSYSLVSQLDLSQSYLDSVQNVQAILEYSLVNPSCYPSFSTVMLPTGASGTAWLNPCASPSQYITVPGFYVPPSFTQCVFIQMTGIAPTAQGAAVVFGSYTLATNLTGGMAIWGDGQLAAYQFDQQQILLNGVTTIANYWTHFCYSYNFTLGRSTIYQDGVAVSTNTMATPAAPETFWSSAATSQSIGGYADGCNNGVQGYMWHEKTYDYELSASQIAALYSAETGGATAPMAPSTVSYPAAVQYCIDQRQGGDSNTGIYNTALPSYSQTTCWKSLVNVEAKLNSVTMAVHPGDSFLFCRGDIYYSTSLGVNLNGKQAYVLGTPSAPVNFTAFNCRSPFVNSTVPVTWPLPMFSSASILPQNTNPSGFVQWTPTTWTSPAGVTMSGYKYSISGMFGVYGNQFIPSVPTGIDALWINGNSYYPARFPDRVNPMDPSGSNPLEFMYLDASRLQNSAAATGTWLPRSSCDPVNQIITLYFAPSSWPYIYQNLYGSNAATFNAGAGSANYYAGTSIMVRTSMGTIDKLTVPASYTTSNIASSTFSSMVNCSGIVGCLANGNAGYTWQSLLLHSVTLTAAEYMSSNSQVTEMVITNLPHTFTAAQCALINDREFFSTTTTVTNSGYSGFGASLYMENNMDFLNAPGEYYYNAGTGVLYVVPFNAADQAAMTATTTEAAYSGLTAYALAPVDQGVNYAVAVVLPTGTSPVFNFAPTTVANMQDASMTSVAMSWIDVGFSGVGIKLSNVNMFVGYDLWLHDLTGRGISNYGDVGYSKSVATASAPASGGAADTFQFVLFNSAFDDIARSAVNVNATFATISNNTLYNCAGYDWSRAFTGEACIQVHLNTQPNQNHAATGSALYAGNSVIRNNELNMTGYSAIAGSGYGGVIELNSVVHAMHVHTGAGAITFTDDWTVQWNIVWEVDGNPTSRVLANTSNIPSHGIYYAGHNADSPVSYTSALLDFTNSAVAVSERPALIANNMVINASGDGLVFTVAGATTTVSINDNTLINCGMNGNFPASGTDVAILQSTYNGNEIFFNSLFLAGTTESVYLPTLPHFPLLGQPNGTVYRNIMPSTLPNLGLNVDDTVVCVGLVNANPSGGYISTPAVNLNEGTAYLTSLTNVLNGLSSWFTELQVFTPSLTNALNVGYYVCATAQIVAQNSWNNASIAYQMSTEGYITNMIVGITSGAYNPLNNAPVYVGLTNNVTGAGTSGSSSTGTSIGIIALIVVASAGGLGALGLVVRQTTTGSTTVANGSTTTGVTPISQNLTSAEIADLAPPFSSNGGTAVLTNNNTLQINPNMGSSTADFHIG